jgi:hypothetical protein
MDGQGSVVISTELTDEQVVITVRDTGPGLPPEAGEELFRPFYTTRTDGTGLGLPIVRKIVVAHGGAVTASNPEAGGAEFLIRLPLESFQNSNSAQALAAGCGDGQWGRRTGRDQDPPRGELPPRHATRRDSGAPPTTV